MLSSTLFSDAMALTRTGDGVYDGVLNEHWTIGEKVHGGAMLAPDPGPMRVVTTVRKRGRRVSLIDVELTQADRVAVRAAVTLGEPEHHVAPLSPRKLGTPVGEAGHSADAA